MYGFKIHEVKSKQIPNYLLVDAQAIVKSNARSQIIH